MLDDGRAVANGEVEVNYTTHIRKEIDESFTWTDVAANCYVCLADAITSVGSFLGEYFEDGLDSERSNPNIDLLRRLEDAVAEAVGGSLERRRTVADSLAYVLDAVSNLCMKPFGSDSNNDVAPFWAIIRGIDRAYGNSNRFASTRARGPLNKVRRDRVGVYLAPPVSALGAGLLSSGLKRIPELTFNSQLSYIKFYEKERGRELPRIRMTEARAVDALAFLESTDEVRQNQSQQQSPMLAKLSSSERVWPTALPSSVRIGMATFSCAEITGMANPKSMDAVGPPIAFSKVHGKAFIASYGANYTNDYAREACDILRVCMDNACDIVLFPELVISGEIREAMRDYLENAKHPSRPALVVAGSSWVPCKSEGRGNNVAFLYDGYGHKIGTYYKHSPLVLYEDDGGVSLVEGLDSPGEKCTIVDIKGIGRVLPSICKDLASDSRYTLDLATAFEPSLVCVPALSTSMDKAFTNPASTLSERNLAVSCVCNQCGFLTRQRAGGTTVALVAMPLASAEESTKTRSSLIPCIRDAGCRDRCLSSTDQGRNASCIHIVDIDCKAFAQEGYVSCRRVPLL